MSEPVVGKVELASRGTDKPCACACDTVKLLIAAAIIAAVVWWGYKKGFFNVATN